MSSDPTIVTITQQLSLARLRLQRDPADTTNSLIYVAHVELLLRKLDHALRMNQLQAEKLRDYIEQPFPPRECRGASGCAEEVMLIG